MMFILAREGRYFARLRINTNPAFECEIPVRRDYSEPFPGCNPVKWAEEYLTNVHPEQLKPGKSGLILSSFDWDADWFFDDTDSEEDLK
ncbi:MAG: hypothetical protein CME33_11690 [Gimesia sp.]|nr:hypothetical protein [Gimesia sp.]